MEKIILHTNSLNERGTTVAVYDYAYYLRKYLNLHPIIAFNKNCQDNFTEVINKFQSEFDVISYNNLEELNQVSVDYFYWLKYGTNDQPFTNNAKNLVHSVFVSDLKEKHGDIYAVVSEWMSLQSNYKISYVPHMINLPDHFEDIRSEIGIPNSHTVIGRTGGFETFDVPFVWEAIERVLQKRNDIWFFLMNTPNVIRNERCFYFDKNTDVNEKVKFINSCDAMLHARVYGETFGLSVAEFASKNKQIITFDNQRMTNFSDARNHFLYLKDNCHKYSNAQDLENILLNITRHNPFDTTYLKEKFSPQNVIQKFEEVFLK